MQFTRIEYSCVAFMTSRTCYNSIQFYHVLFDAKECELSIIIDICDNDTKINIQIIINTLYIYCSCNAINQITIWHGICTLNPWRYSTAV